MVWGNPANLAPNIVFAQAIYNLYDEPDTDEEEALNEGRNPWRGDELEPQETLDCDDVQRFLVWCAFHQKPFKLRYYSPTRSMSLTVDARVFLSVLHYPNIHPLGGQELENPYNPFVFTHRRNDNVWCLVAWINDRENGQDRGRWITAREYNSVDDRRYPRVKGINDDVFFNDDVRGVNARRDCYGEVEIDEEEMQEPDFGAPAGPEPESEPEEEAATPTPRRVTRSQSAAAAALASGPAQNTRSQRGGRGRDSSVAGSRGGRTPLIGGRGGARGRASSGAGSRGGGRASGRGGARGRASSGAGARGGGANRGRGGRGPARGRGTAPTPTRRVTRSMTAAASGPAQNTRSRRGGRQ